MDLNKKSMKKNSRIDCIYSNSCGCIMEIRYCA